MVKTLKIMLSDTLMLLKMPKIWIIILVLGGGVLIYKASIWFMRKILCKCGFDEETVYHIIKFYKWSIVLVSLIIIYIIALISKFDG